MRLKDISILYPRYSGRISDEAVAFVPMESLREDAIDAKEISVAEGNAKYTYFADNDLLIAKVTPCFENGNISVAKDLKGGIGFGSSEIFVLRFDKRTNPRYMFYLAESAPFQAKACSTMCGVGGLKRISPLFMRTYELNLPSLPEQNKIVAFLDKQLNTINERMFLRDGELQTLNKLKQSEISSVISHGLDANVPMRDSGIDWIGQIPAHWEISRIKDVASLGSGTTPKSGVDKYYDNGTIPWLNTSDVQNRLITQSTYFITEKAVEDYPVLHYYPENTVLLAMYGGGTIGNVGLMAFPAMINQACCAITPKKGLDSKYLYYYLLNKQNWIVSTGFGGTQINLSQKLIAQYYITIPPFDEQKRIVEFLDSKCQQLDDAYANIELQISKLKLLKKALINEVISGQRTL